MNKHFRVLREYRVCNDGAERDGTGRDATGRDGTGRDGTGRGRDATTFETTCVYQLLAAYRVGRIAQRNFLCGHRYSIETKLVATLYFLLFPSAYLTSFDFPDTKDPGCETWKSGIQIHARSGTKNRSSKPQRVHR